MAVQFIPIAIKAAKVAAVASVARAKSYPKRKIQEIRTAPQRRADRLAQAPADAIANAEARMERRLNQAGRKAGKSVFRKLLIGLLILLMMLWYVAESVERAAKDYAKEQLGPFGMFIDAGYSACGPVEEDSVITVADFGYTTGKRVSDAAKMEPKEFGEITTKSIEMLGAFFGAFTHGAKGDPVPQALNDYDARVVATRAAEVNPCGIPCASNNAQDGPGLARAAAAAAGFTGQDLEIAVGVAGAESSFRPDATNTNGNGSVDHGLFQINSVHATILATGDWKDPYANARMAKAVYDDAGGWTPWVTYKNGAYKNHMSAATGVADCSVGSGEGGFIAASFGGYENGKIPADALIALKADPSHRLQPQAAAAFDLLSDAYQANFGTPIEITDSYRDYAGQVDCRKRKGNMCATPGTSNHGWGAAIDLGGGINRFGTPQHAWMVQNAPQYGWILPAWAQANGSKPEPWHWEFQNAIKAG